MEKIDKLKHPPEIGKYYLVPCIIKEEFKFTNNELPDYEVSKTGELEIANGYFQKSLDIYPIINHLHHDKENGQNYYHYHVDYRFIELEIRNNDYIEIQMPSPLKKKLNHTYARWIRYDLLGKNKEYKIEYHPFKCIRHNNHGIAGKVNISKLNYKCLHRGKCPHKGYDLSQEIPNKEGIIQCPLHGLRFKKDTGELIEK